MLFRIVDGKRRAVKLDKAGAVSFKVPDRNRARPTTYVAAVRSTPTTVAAETGKVRVR